MPVFKIGQKWISNAEPELAMGQVTRIEDRRVSVYFDLVGEDRTYAVHQAPLSRVKFSPGDEVRTQHGIEIVITSVSEKDDMFVYHGDYEGTSTAVIETELDPNVRFSKPEDRLFTSQFDKNSSYHLRVITRQQIAARANTPVQGLVGPRIGLIPHQLYIASEVADRFAPRVLLADEVGLGKTIEAGLVLHQQLHTGRAERALIIVPEALTFQWFIEMIRHFNLQFTILDEARCLDIVSDMSPASELDDEEMAGELALLKSLGEDIEMSANPFEAQQLMICSINLFKDNPERLEQALDADWDLVIVDEAHHLRYEQDEVSIEYKIVELLSATAKGLLLLTATPEQLGKLGHFARLRLLDPDRFNDYDSFLKEEENFAGIAEAAASLIGQHEDAAEARAKITELVGETGDDESLLRALLDRHGTGRVLFRNVRAGIEGFADRVPLPVSLEKPAAYDSELYPEERFDDWFDVDPRVEWIIDLLEAHKNQKFLLIGRKRETILALEKALNAKVAIRTTVFHEGLDLVARDRAANYFADTELGAQIMLCSEIGSEGRNFQFASHLILFDLPQSPDLTEQRIGRLDRIGQRYDVKLHIPYFTDTDSEKLYDLFNDGFNLFTQPNPVAQNLYNDLDLSSFDVDLGAVQSKNQDALEALQHGRDRLLELNSFNEERANELVDGIIDQDLDRSLEAYMEASFDHFGLESEDLGQKVVLLKPTEGIARNESISAETMGHFHYPELPDEGVRFTYHRETAQTREDVHFLTWESPLVAQAVDAVTSDFAGNSTMIVVKHPSLKAGTLLLETMSVVDCPAAKHLDVDRYLPPKLIRHLIAPSLNDVSTKLRYDSMVEYTVKVPGGTYKKIMESQADGIKNMLEKAKTLAAGNLSELIDAAKQKANVDLGAEIQRLTALKAVNSNIRDVEVMYLEQQLSDVLAVLDRTQVRLDALRVIVATA
jgi:ATP-dependent helicase HepA